MRNNFALYGCIFGLGVLQEGIETLSLLCQDYFKVNFSFVPITACQILGEAFFESINDNDYSDAVLQIIVGPEKSGDENCEEDVSDLVRKIHRKLEDSPVEIMPFIKSCTRNGDFFQTQLKNSY